MVAPFDQQEQDIRESDPNNPISYTSYMPEVQHIPAPSRLRRKPPRPRTQRKPIRVSWVPLAILAVIPPLIFAGLVVYDWMRPQRVALDEYPDTYDQEPVFYVTATPQLDLALTATSILPPEYMQSLSATPPPLAALEGPAATPTVAFAPSGDPTQPFFTPFRSKIVYVCHVNGSDELCLMNGDGSEQVQLTSLEGTDWYPSLSPDGQTIAFSSQRGKGTYDIYLMDIGGGNIRQVTHNERHYHAYAPEISPDGTKIVYTSTAAGKGDQDIWVINIDGSNPTQITYDTTNEIDPSWSPDGTMISFASNRSGTNELFIMNADGSNILQVTRWMSIGGRNDWSPDGNWLTFYAGPGSEKEIFLVPRECAYIGGGCDRSLIRQLTNGGQNKGPAFSPDGQWITYTSKYDGDNEVMIMRIDGSDIRQLTFNSTRSEREEEAADWMPRWGP